jgi:hypothetical protein
MARIVLGSYMVRYPLGGMLSWALQYVIGLQRLGHDVVFVEKAHYPQACFSPTTGVMTDDASEGVGIVAGLLARFGMPGRWCFVDYSGVYHGMTSDQVNAEFRSADLFIDMGTHGAWAEESTAARRRVLVDGEPGFTQMKRASRIADGVAVTEYDAYYTSGLNIGTERSTAPTAGVEWQPLPHPVVLDLFDPTPPPRVGAITTVMNWQSYTPLEYKGRTYGHKDVSFEAFADLPSKVDAPLELAVGGPSVPVEHLVDLGWHVRNGHEVTRTIDDFWAYIVASRAEFSLCKEGYVATGSGWFSDRGGAYLASGRPVIQQDTGFGALLPLGEGLFAVSSVDEAAAAIDAVLTHPDRHAASAREIAESHLDSRVVLAAWLDDALQ